VQSLAYQLNTLIHRWRFPMKLATAARFCLCLMLSVALSGLVIPPLPARAGAVFNVACGDTAGLIQAMVAANNETDNPGQDTIILAPNCTTPYTFSTGYANPDNTGDATPDIATSINIIGNGAVLERSYAPATPSFRLFDVKYGGELILDAVTIRNFSTSFGSAIVNYGVTIVTNSTFEGNVATSYAAAVANRTTMRIENSTINGNSAPNGAAIDNWNPNTSVYINELTLVNVTIANNSATTGAAALYNDNNARAILIHTTISRNNSGMGSYSIYTAPTATTRMRSSIIETNSPVNCSTTVINEGGNIQWGDSTCGSGILTANPFLESVAANGGPVKTMALGANSPAREMGIPEHCPLTDARGASRPQPWGSICDSGAYESNVARYYNSSARFEPSPVLVGQPTVFKFDLQNVHSAQLTGASASFTLPESIAITGAPSTVGVCTVTVDAPLGSRTITYTIGTVPAAQTCGFQVPVTAWVGGTHTLVEAATFTNQTGTYGVYPGHALQANPAGTTTSLTSGKGDGSAINLSAKVRPAAPGAGTPKGYVAFYILTAPAASLALTEIETENLLTDLVQEAMLQPENALGIVLLDSNGNASLTATSLPSGKFFFVALYSGSESYNPSSSTFVSPPAYRLFLPGLIKK
jgi:hypothetical protein